MARSKHNPTLTRLLNSLASNIAENRAVIETKEIIAMLATGGAELPQRQRRGVTARLRKCGWTCHVALRAEGGSDLLYFWSKADMPQTDLASYCAAQGGLPETLSECRPGVPNAPAMKVRTDSMSRASRDLMAFIYGWARYCRGVGA